MKFQGDLLLTDPMFLIKPGCGSDWNRVLSEGCDHAALHRLGITEYLSAELGDEGRRKVLDPGGEEIGRFCSDSALFCVCDLKQALAYHPDFLTRNAKYPDSFCVIRGFSGEVSVIRDETGVQLIGIGENGFKTVSP